MGCFQVQKKHYRKEKKRAAKELLSTLKDPSVIVMADWLKVRGTLKGWTKLWCVLKPGLLVLYKSHKAKVGCYYKLNWVGKGVGGRVMETIKFPVNLHGKLQGRISSLSPGIH